MDRPDLDCTIEVNEIARFQALADEWWNPDGKFRVMHAFNHARRDFIEKYVAQKFQRSLKHQQPLAGIKILDVGCGGGLICEPLALLGATVVGVDATSRNIDFAKRHARQAGISIDYRHGTAQSAVSPDENFDVVLNLEVIEHVADPAKLMTDCASRLKPGGLLFIATLNRTIRALVLAIYAAEYVLRWLPVGTHDWRRFLKPNEIEAMLRSGKMRVIEMVGVTMNPLNRNWKVTSDPSVNYMLVAEKESLSEGS
ncbi:MAG: bifunctional 2-polyprenyl-6-hydroxyphenol methylase/3-demethylubiquinol 3-O-methyltransferase UbiG [Gammaproteobacteria bacterium]